MIFSKIKSWWIDLVYGSKEEQEHIAWMDKEFPGWREELELEREESESYPDTVCGICGKNAKEVLLIEDRQGDFYCRSCFNIKYDPDMRYAEGIGFYKSFK